MDDQFLNDPRRDPSPEFARDLRQRLRRDERAREDALPPARRGRMLPPALAAAAALVVVALFVSPSVRASAQAFLDLFRVRNFTAVTFDAERMKQLDGKLDFKALLSDRVQTVLEPGPPRIYLDVAKASQVTGLTLRTPATLPTGLQLDSVSVMGEGIARLTVDVARLRKVLDALELSDVAVPRELDGKVVTIRKPTIVAQHYLNGEKRVEFMQSKSPEVSLPAGTDLARLGEIALRVLGTSAADAARLARQIDWRTTLLVPVPTDAGSFREITVHGQKGLLVTRIQRETDGSGRRRAGALVMWSEGDMVYALAGNLDSDDLVLMANSTR